MNRVNQATRPAAAARCSATASRCRSSPRRCCRSSPSIRPRARATRCSCPTSRPSTCSTRCARVPGVGEATLFGALDYAMRIWLDLDRMASLGLTPQRRRQRGARPRTSRPRSAASAPRRCPTTSSSSSTSPPRAASSRSRSSSNIIVRANPDGALVRLSDIGRVELGAKSQRLARAATTASRPPASPSTSRPAPMRWPSPRACATAMKELATRFPDDVAYDVMYDTTVFVQATIESVHPHADRGLRAGGHRRLHLPRQPARHPDSRSSRCRWR